MDIAKYLGKRKLNVSNSQEENEKKQKIKGESEKSVDLEPDPNPHDNEEGSEDTNARPEKKYPRKFRIQWMNEYPWLEERDKKAYCKACNKILTNNKKHLERHNATEYHKNNASIKLKQNYELGSSYVLSPPSNGSMENPWTPASSSMHTTTSQQSVGRKPKKPKLTKAESVLLKFEKQLNVQDDSFVSTGKYIASKLRSLPREAGIFAEKLIMDVLFEAQLGTLNRDSKIVTSLVVQEIHTSSTSQWAGRPLTQDEESWSITAETNLTPTVNAQTDTGSEQAADKVAQYGSDHAHLYQN